MLSYIFSNELLLKQKVGFGRKEMLWKHGNLFSSYHKLSHVFLFYIIRSRFVLHNELMRAQPESTSFIEIKSKNSLIFAFNRMQL